MINRDVISMPDKWEYPWYAAWDLAFHAIPLAMVDPTSRRTSSCLMLDNRYQHPNGQIPAYEWNFGDVNPPVHAAAAMQVYLIDRTLTAGKPDLDFLKTAFTKLLVNFTWWVNRKDRAGNNCFEGGFLGLDNIGVFDRSAPLPTGGHLDQADGTAWMVVLQPEHAADGRRARATTNRVYEDVRDEVLRAHDLDRGGHGPHRRPARRDVGRGGRLLLRRPPASGRLGAPPRGAVHGRVCFRSPPSPSSRRTSSRGCPASGRRHGRSSRRHPELCADIHLPPSPGSRTAACSRS